VSAERHNLPAVVETVTPITTPTLLSSLVVPAMIAEAGDRAARRFLDFFAASIENDNTAWPITGPSARSSLGSGASYWRAPRYRAFHVAAYIKALKVSDAGNPAVKERAAARPTVKQHLAAIRMLFDWLIVGQILAINPAHAVRGPKHVVKRGKTPVLTRNRHDGCSEASRSSERSLCPTARKPTRLGWWACVTAR